ncbi:MAG: nickel-dependent lactate racemase, partial [candidate division WOR-3 bacterium]
MQVFFPYPDIEPLTVDDKLILGVFSPSSLERKSSITDMVSEAIDNPIGSPPLPHVLEKAKSVLLLTDDYTRSTPASDILPPLVEKIESCGIRGDSIAILIALGTHRPMSQTEIERKLGKDICAKYKVVNHEWWDESKLVYLGETESGTPVIVNKMAAEFDVLIGVGQIVPHRVTGFSGGGNIVQPGICGEITTGRTHWLAAQYTGREILGKIENPVKEEVEKVALMAKLKWIVNTIQDGQGNVISVVAGDPLLAYRAGAKISLEVYKAEMPCEADIVITDSFPFDSELWL